MTWYEHFAPALVILCVLGVLVGIVVLGEAGYLGDGDAPAQPSEHDQSSPNVYVKIPGMLQQVDPANGHACLPSGSVVICP